MKVLKSIKPQSYLGTSKSFPLVLKKQKLQWYTTVIITGRRIVYEIQGYEESDTDRVKRRVPLKTYHVAL